MLALALALAIAGGAVGSSVALAGTTDGFQVAPALTRLTAATHGSLLATLGRRSAAAEASPCIIHSLASFTDQGEFRESSSIADVVEVECQPVYSGLSVRVSSVELYDRCGRNLTWSVPYPYGALKGPSFSMKLDNDGNATAVLWGGPSCAAGESLISAHMESAPYSTVTTGFTVLPPRPSATGVSTAPSSEVEDEVTSSVATIVQVEFPPVYAERLVNINAEQLYARCGVEPHLVWVGPDANTLAEGTGSVTVKLDNDGNAFVVALGGASCAAGTSEVEASLEQAPYTTVTTDFTILPPEPTIEPEPVGGYRIEKFQKLASKGAFTQSRLTAELGETVDYKIVVTNTGELPLTFSNFTDAHCTNISGGPTGPVPTFGSTTWTCEHALTVEGEWTNEATVEGSEKTGTKTSNKVVVEAMSPPPPPKEPMFTVEKLQKIAGEYTTSELTGMVGEIVSYEIVVKNTGEVPIKLEKITDPKCTNIAGPPNVDPGPGESTTYTCEHVITEADVGTKYRNVATVQAGKKPEESNEVVVHVPVKGFKVEKLQKISGEYSTTALTGMPGQTVDYEVIVTNTGEVPIKLEKLSDIKCANIVSPVGFELAVGASAIYTCEHLLAKADEGHAYTNVASVEAGEEAKESNEVVVYVPTKSFKVQKLQRISGEYVTTELTGSPGQTIHYEFIVTNTGEASLTLGKPTDPNCTNILGPTKAVLAPKETASYTCEHLLTEADAGKKYTNVAVVEAGGEVEKSNEVVVSVPAFTIEKLQKIAGGFTKAPLTGIVGQTIDYEVIVTNTGEVPLTFGTLTDPNCSNVLEPSKSELAPKEVATYTCEHKLTVTGPWANQATITGTPSGAAPISHTSNQVLVYQPGYTIQKLQRIKGESAYTTAELHTPVGGVVQYEVLVTNTGEVALAFMALHDPNCENIAGGPSTLAVGASATYTCEHTLTTVGQYVNEASIEGDEGTGVRTSNSVVVNSEKAVVENAKQLEKPACKATANYVLQGASGPKKKAFKVHVSALAAKEITFYLDGHELKRLKHAQAKNGIFTVIVKVRGLKRGQHHLSFTTSPADTNCKAVSQSRVFIVPAGAVVPTFTG